MMRSACIAAVVLFAAAAARADTVALDDSHTWAGGSDTLVSDLGFHMVQADIESLPDYAYVDRFPTVHGDVVLGQSAQKRTVPTGWRTWSHGAEPGVLWTVGATSLDLALPAGVNAIDFYLEPNPFAVVSFTVTTDGGTATVTQDIDGYAGAKYFGFYSTDGAFSSIEISADTDFAIGEVRVANPEPGTLALLGAALAGAYAWRRRRRA